MKGVPPDITDEEIDQEEMNFSKLPKTSEFQKIGNYIRLKNVRKSIFPQSPIPLLPLENFNYFWLRECETLFIEGMHGPCCIWTRSILELALLKECKVSTLIPNDFRDRILSKGSNPKINECSTILRSKDVIDNDDLEKIETIRINGNNIVHHRIDEITQNMSLRELLIQIGVSENDLSAQGFKENEDRIRESVALMNERRIAIESIEMLYNLICKRHWHC